MAVMTKKFYYSNTSKFILFHFHSRSTAEILPPSIGIFGGHPGQMSFGSVPFSAASFHSTSSSTAPNSSSINFGLHDQ